MCKKWIEKLHAGNYKLDIDKFCIDNNIEPVKFNKYICMNKTCKMNLSKYVKIDNFKYCPHCGEEFAEKYREHKEKYKAFQKIINDEISRLSILQETDMFEELSLLDKPYRFKLLNIAYKYSDNFYDDYDAGRYEVVYDMLEDMNSVIKDILGNKSLKS
jgi:hypothetical protein